MCLKGGMTSGCIAEEAAALATKRLSSKNNMTAIPSRLGGLRLKTVGNQKQKKKKKKGGCCHVQFNASPLMPLVCYIYNKLDI